MFKSIFLIAPLLIGSMAFAEPVFKIEVGRSRGKSNEDLERRVWELERAVWQLQQKVFNLEKSKKQVSADSWLCEIRAMGETYTGTGPSKAVATQKAMKDCKSGQKGSTFFCKDAECSQ